VTRALEDVEVAEPVDGAAEVRAAGGERVEPVRLAHDEEAVRPLPVLVDQEDAVRVTPRLGADDGVRRPDADYRRPTGSSAPSTRRSEGLRGPRRRDRPRRPLDRKTVELVKLGIAVGGRLEGAVHAHVRRARDHGASPEEIRHAIRLALTTVGFPTMMSALSWANDVLAGK
jgi:AhpD family alkylhydroperoxidase